MLNPCHATPVNNEKFFKKYSIETHVFCLVFIALFTSLKFYTFPGSYNNVEQWINLTNQMFYGSQDFLFSYGPLYWLTGGTSTQYSPYTYWLSIAFLSMLSAFFWSSIFTLSYKARTIYSLVGVYFIFFNSLLVPVSLILWPFSIVAYLEFSRSTPIGLRTKELILFGLLVGASFYIRFFYGFVGTVIFLSYFFTRLFSQKKLGELFYFLASLMFGYSITGLLIFHNKASLIDYLLINNQLNFGNSVDMTLDGMSRKSVFIVAFIATIFFNIYLILKKRSLLLTINALLLIFFKIGFSRADHALSYFVIPAATLALVMTFENSRISRRIFPLVIGCLFYIGVYPSYAWAPKIRLLPTATNFKIDYASRMQNAYAQYKLDKDLVDIIADSTIDVYPYNNEYLFANKLNYLHRPLFQNYMTLTPVLDKLNKEFFESEGRPKFILWTSGLRYHEKNCNPFNGFDQKFSLNEDPLTSSSILLNYHVVRQSTGKDSSPIMLLKENDIYTAYSYGLVSKQVMKFGEWYTVPPVRNGVAKLIPELIITPYGKLKNLLFRGSILKIKYRMFSGEIREYRLNILNTKSGIWVSPLLDSFELTGSEVEAIMLESDSARYFKATFNAKWINVPIKLIS